MAVTTYEMEMNKRISNGNPTRSLAHQKPTLTPTTTASPPKDAYCYGFGRMIGKVDPYRTSDWSTVESFNHAKKEHPRIKEIKFFFN